MINKTHSFSLRFVTRKNSDEIVNVIFDSLRHFFEALTPFLSLFCYGIDKIIDFKTLSSWQLDDFKLRNLFQYSINSLFLDRNVKIETFLTLKIENMKLPSNR